MTTIKHGNDAGLADFLAKLDWANATEPLAFGYAVIALTNFGERPVEITRLAEVLELPVNQAETRARQWGGWPGTRVENRIITVNPERAGPVTGWSRRVRRRCGRACPQSAATRIPRRRAGRRGSR